MAHSDRIWQVAGDAVPDLVTAIYSPSRHDQLVVMSPSSDGNGPRLRPEKVARAVGRSARVAVLDSMGASRQFSDRMPPQLRAYGGAIRVMRPGASTDDPSRVHPLVTVYDDDDTADRLRKVVELVHRGRHATVTPLSAPELRPVTERVSVLQGDVAGGELQAAEVARLTREAEQLRTELVEAQDRMGEQQRQIARLDRQLQEARQAVARAMSVGEQAPVVWRDPEQQLRWEVEWTWLTHLDEDDRMPLRNWRVGPEFIASLEQHIVPRSKTVQLMVEVLVGQVHQRRAIHQWLDGRGGKQRIRWDKAAGWRCNVKSESPGAPRLTYWELVDGSVEFDHVGHHDARL